METKNKTRLKTIKMIFFIILKYELDTFNYKTIQRRKQPAVDNVDNKS